MNRTGRPRLTRRFVRAFGRAASTYTRTACGQRAAAISYHVLFSLVPFVALLVSVLELVLPETLQDRVVAWLVGVVSLPDPLADSVESAIQNAGPPATLMGAIALAGLIWAASGMMTSVRSAFRAVWGSEVDRPYVRGKLLDLVLVLGAGMLVVSAFGLSLVVQVVTQSSSKVAEELGLREAEGLDALAQLGLSLALAVVAFVLLYRVVPPEPPRLRDVVPGAVVAAVGVHVASAGFSIYLAHFGDFNEVYGPLGAVLAFLVLVYVAAKILLFGACIAAAWPESAAEPAADEKAIAFRSRLVGAARGLVRRESGTGVVVEDDGPGEEVRKRPSPL
jgi:membrane protein